MYGESGVGIMNKQDYIYLYWKNYISIEKEFTQTLLERCRFVDRFVF